MNCLLDVVSFINKSIDLCSDDKCCPYHSQCLVIFQSSSSVISIHSDSSNSSSKRSGKSRLSVCEYFNEYTVEKIIIVERPLDKCQIYVAAGLGHKYHFSCPTTQVPTLINIIKHKHNSDINLLFIPRSCELYHSNELIVFNHIITENPITSKKDGNFDIMYEAICNESSGASHRSSLTEYHDL
jgi:hypothetical protein